MNPKDFNDFNSAAKPSSPSVTATARSRISRRRSRSARPMSRPTTTAASPMKCRAAAPRRSPISAKRNRSTRTTRSASNSCVCLAFDGGPARAVSGFDPGTAPVRARRANHFRFTEIVSSQKSDEIKNISLFQKCEIVAYIVIPSRPEGRRDRHERGAGSGGRGRRLDERRWKRTAKTCGPDVAVLASSWRHCLVATVAKEPSPGRARYKP